MTTIKIEHNLEPIAPKNDVRNYLVGALLDSKDQRVIATNGHMLVNVPVTEGVIDDDAIVPRKALEDMRKESKKGYPASLDLNGETVTVHSTKDTDRKIEHKLVDARWPDWRSVVKDPLTNNGKVSLALNAEYLAAIQKSLGGVGVRLVFNPTEPGMAIRVEPISGYKEPSIDAYGVLMPIRDDRERS